MHRVMHRAHGPTSLLLALVGSLAPASGLARDRLPVAVVAPDHLPTARRAVVDRALVAALAAAGVEALPPAQVRDRLEGRRELVESRSRAAELLAGGKRAVREMRYPDAVRLLRRAEEAARRGLARLVAPRLLASIYRCRGIALLPTRPAAARRAFLLSALHHPGQALDTRRLPPKIVRELKRAAAEARVARSPTLTQSEARRLLAALEARRVLVATPRPGRLTLRMTRSGGPAWSTSVTWPPGAPAREVREAITAGLRVHVGPPADGAGRARRPWTWLALGVAGAATVTGSVLAALTQRDKARAEELAGRTPLVEYAPEARDLEAAAGRYQTGAVVTFTVAGVAAAAAVALWLWPSRSEQVSSRSWLPAPGGICVALP
jgi:hypothetical protein